MVYFPLSIIVYLFVASTCLAEGLRSLKTYFRTNNQYSKLLSQVALGVAATQYIYAFSNILFPDSPDALGMFYIIALFPIFFGLKQGLQIALTEWQWMKTIRFINIFLPLALLIFTVLHFQHIPQPVTDSAGLIHWRVPFPFSVIIFVSGALLTLPTALFLSMTPAKSKKSKIKKHLFSVTFLLGGIFGWSLVFLDNPALLLTSYLLMAMGFVFMVVMILVDILMKETIATSDGAAGHY